MGPTSRTLEGLANFAGREWLLREAVEWWEQRTGERIFVITGDPGAGKSSILAWLAGFGLLPRKSKGRAELSRLRAAVNASHFFQSGSRNISPQAFAASIANQLTETVPGFAEALAASLAEQVHISGTAKAGRVVPGATVVGVAISEVHLSGLSDELSFDRAFTVPLKKLFASGHSDPILLLVDALDEAATYSGLAVPMLLAGLRDFPAQVRIVATTRNDPRVLKHFRAIKPFDVSPRDRASAKDLLAFIRRRARQLSTPSKAQRTRFIQRLMAQGNFLYAALVLDDLLSRRGKQAVELDDYALPRDLSGLYHEFLNRELGVNEGNWFDTYKPLLGLIAAAQDDGLTAEQLSALIDKDVEAGLRKCMQYLVGALPNGPFKIFHPSFRQFLFEDEKNLDYRIDPVAMHERIAAYYWPENESGGVTQAHRRRPLVDASYGERNLATHLFMCRQLDKLQALMSPRWAQLRWKSDGYNYDGFLADLELAWRLSEGDDRERADAGQEVRNTQFCVRCAILRSTIVSLATVLTPPLLIAAVRTGVWDAPRGLATARSIAEPTMKATALVGMMEFLSQQERVGVAREALRTVETIVDEFYRSLSLGELIAVVPETILPDVLASVRSFRGGQHAAHAVVSLVARLSRTTRRSMKLLSGAIKVAISIPEAQWRGRALSEMYEHLPDALRQNAVSAILAIAEISPRFDALLAVTRVASPVGKRAATAALDIVALGQVTGLSLDQISALPTAAAQVGLHEQALTAIGHVPAERRSRVLAAIIDGLPDDYVMRAAQGVRALPERRARATVAVVRRLGAIGRVADAFEIACADDSEGRDRALRMLIPQLSFDLARRILALERPGRGWDYDDILAETARRLTEIGHPEEALQAVRRVKSDYWTARSLTAIARDLPVELAPNALSIALLVVDPASRARAILPLMDILDAGARPSALEQAIVSARMAVDRSERVEILSIAARHAQPALQHKLHKEALAIAADAIRAGHVDFLKRAGPELPDELLNVVFVAVRGMTDPNAQNRALSMLAVELARRNHQADALAAISLISRQFDAGEALVEAARWLDPVPWDEMLSAARKLPQLDWRCRVMAELVRLMRMDRRATTARMNTLRSTDLNIANCVAELRYLAAEGFVADAHAIASELQDWDAKGKALAALIPFVDENDQRAAVTWALNAMRPSDGSVNLRGYGLSALKDMAPRLQRSVVAEILARAQTLHDPQTNFVLPARIVIQAESCDRGALAKMIIDALPHRPRSERSSGLRGAIIAWVAPFLSAELAGEALEHLSDDPIQELEQAAIGLAPRLAQLGRWKRALQIARGLSTAYQDIALTAIAQHCPVSTRLDLLAELIERAPADWKAQPRWIGAISAAVVDLSDEQVSALLARTETLQSQAVRAIVLSALATNLHQRGRLGIVMAAAEAVGDDRLRAHPASRLAPLARDLPEGSLLRSVMAIRSDQYRADALGTLAPTLVTTEAEQAIDELLRIAKESVNWMNRKTALESLRPHLSRISEQARQVAILAADRLGPIQLALLIPHLPEGSRSKVVNAALRRANESERILVVPYLADPAERASLPELTSQILGRPGGRDLWMIASIAPRLAQLPVPELLPIWQSALRSIGVHIRQDMTLRLELLIPAFLVLGGCVAAADLIQSIDEISSTWP